MVSADLTRSAAPRLAAGVFPPTTTSEEDRLAHQHVWGISRVLPANEYDVDADKAMVWASKKIL
jgi:hypothetical protein